MAEAMQAGVLDRKEKECIALGMAMTQQCHSCIALHDLQRHSVAVRECYID